MVGDSRCAQFLDMTVPPGLYIRKVCQHSGEVGHSSSLHSSNSMKVSRRILLILRATIEMANLVYCLICIIIDLYGHIGAHD